MLIMLVCLYISVLEYLYINCTCVSKLVNYLNIVSVN